MLQEFIQEPRVAYFSMEIALRSEIPTYAGGLGILAGDTVRTAADLDLPLVAVTLASRRGYFRQQIDPEGRQTEHDALWDPAAWARPVDARASVSIEGRTVWVGAWLYVLENPLGVRAPVLLLDTDLTDNQEQDRHITDYLYGDGDDYRLKQEVVLGVGGLRLLHALGFRIRQYHMNEGHSALLGVELLRRHAYPSQDLRPGESRYDLPRVRALCRFTTHTPIEAGHDRFPYALVERILTPSDAAAGFVETGMLRRLAGEESLNMTRLALTLSEYVNGVAERHAEVSQRMFPGYHVHAITNGVHPGTWTAAPFRDLYSRYVPAWRHEPELLARVDCCVPEQELWQAHLQCKRALIELVRTRTGVQLQEGVPILGFARRMTAYKRPDLLFTDLQRLRDIAREHPFQIVLAGKAHPRDAPGKQLIAQLHRHAQELAGVVTVVYLVDYDMQLAQQLVSGVDLWLNTPLPPQEASGTSGMKAALNAVPSLSVLDGWWLEGCIEGVTGWAVGGRDQPAEADAAALYDKLQHVVLPLQATAGPHDSPWGRVMAGTVAKNGAYFHSYRMMRRYASEAYLR